MLGQYSGVDRTTFTGAYPFARIEHDDRDLPVAIALEAWSPFVPLEPETSGIPAAFFTFRISNPGLLPVSGAIAATLKNVIGWNAVDPIEGNFSPHFGGNVNRVHQAGGVSAVVMENPSLAASDPAYGQMCLATTDKSAHIFPAWTNLSQFFAQLERAPEFRPETEANQNGVWHEGYRPNFGTDRYSRDLPSSAGCTWNGAVLVPFRLEPGESTEATFVLSWSFLNRYVNYDQPARDFRYELGKSRLWLGNAYGNQFANAIETITHVISAHDELYRQSRLWSDTLLGSSLPEWVSEFLLAQGAFIRSPTSFRTEDGRFYGFEGTQGASTAIARGWRGYSGSCPLNCTHVWNYEQALSRLFPSLERTVRETDYDFVQAPEGYIPHRTLVPLFVRQLWNQHIGGPENPALDGMLGELLKTYREVQQGAGTDWLEHYWPNIRKLYTYIAATWDPDHDGVLEGEQPNTYDIEFWGTNIFIGALWLAAARATEEMARIVGDAAIMADARNRFEAGRRNYDEQLWNGQYYIQTLKDDEPREQQFLTGCLADQLLGQWLAHQLGLGYVLPEDHVRQTLKSIVRFNTRTDFNNWNPEERAFADGDDHGLVIISWSGDYKPDRPTRYHDEVWTGIEYQVAAHCIHEGLFEEGMAVLQAARNRHDGVKRNPYNDIECGDHYARAMSGWAILEALSGYRYDAVRQCIRFSPTESGAFRSTFVAETGWGELLRNERGRISISLLHGSLHLAELDFPSMATPSMITLDGESVPFEPWGEGSIRLQGGINMVSGGSLIVHP